MQARQLLFVLGVTLFLKKSLLKLKSTFWITRSIVCHTYSLMNSLITRLMNFDSFYDTINRIIIILNPSCIKFCQSFAIMLFVPFSFLTRIRNNDNHKVLFKIYQLSDGFSLKKIKHFNLSMPLLHFSRFIY